MNESVAAAQSWGRYPRYRHVELNQRWRFDPLNLPATPATLLPHGMGRSYGDSCLNADNALLHTADLSHFISFDRQTGILRAEAGVTLSEIIDLVVPQGWFLPVTPGTRFVTLGGAIANDVHGKNHHVVGTFGNFVNGFELLRSDGSRRWCTPSSNAEWFRATVGGLGLTGLITSAEICLKRIGSRRIRGQSTRYNTLEDFLRLSLASENEYEYLVAWVDCLASGKNLGRGILMRGNHDAEGPLTNRDAPPTIPCPVDLPEFALNPFTVGAFNNLYFGKHGKGTRQTASDLIPFFYPLDSVGDWNRIYGKRGFLQWQCLVPLGNCLDTLRRIFTDIARERSASFVVVMKTMGDLPSAGNLSFNGRGVTLAVDFAAAPKVFELLDRLDTIVVEAGGKLYPAKDARMRPEVYQAMYPAWRDHERWIDPRFSSSFWRRVTSQ